MCVGLLGMRPAHATGLNGGTAQRGCSCRDGRWLVHAVCPCRRDACLLTQAAGAVGVVQQEAEGLYLVGYLVGLVKWSTALQVLACPEGVLR